MALKIPGTSLVISWTLGLVTWRLEKEAVDILEREDLPHRNAIGSLPGWHNMEWRRKAAELIGDKLLLTQERFRSIRTEALQQTHTSEEKKVALQKFEEAAIKETGYYGDDLTSALQDAHTELAKKAVIRTMLLVPEDIRKQAAETLRTAQNDKAKITIEKITQCAPHHLIAPALNASRRAERRKSQHGLDVILSALQNGQAFGEALLQVLNKVVRGFKPAVAAIADLLPQFKPPVLKSMQNLQTKGLEDLTFIANMIRETTQSPHVLKKALDAVNRADARGAQAIAQMLLNTPKELQEKALTVIENVDAEYAQRTAAFIHQTPNHCKENLLNRLFLLVVKPLYKK